MNKFERYKPDFDSEEGRKIFYKKVWDLIKYLFILTICLFVCFLVTFCAVVSNRNDNESAFAEVSTLSVNTQYFFDTLVPRWSITTSSDNFSDSGFSGIISRLSNVASFDSISWTYYSSTNRVTFYSGSTPTCRLIISYPNGNRYFSAISFYNSSTSTWGDNYSFSSSSYDDSIQIMFSSLGSNVHFRNTFLDCLSVYVPPVVVPDSPTLVPASIPYIQYLDMIHQVYDYSENTYVWDSDVIPFDILQIDYANYYWNSDYGGVVLWLEAYDNNDVLIFRQKIYGKTVSDISDDAYFLIALPDLYEYKLQNNIAYFHSYPETGGLYYTTYSSTVNSPTYSSLLRNIDGFHNLKESIYNDGYRIGYSAGIDTDKTLLSVMWQTFNLPFRLLFGSYDDVQSSPTYGQYVGGLFNFSILGVDIRAFCIGIMSFAIVLAVVRVVLGSKG